MANFDLYFPIEKSLEGTVFENDPLDSGGATKFGITKDDLHEYEVDFTNDGKIDWQDVKALDDSTASKVLKKLYWDFFKADKIENQSIAQYIVDSGLNQGRILIAKYVQSILGLNTDGMFGNISISKINTCNQQDLFDKLKQKRIDRYNSIIASKPSQIRFKNGWMNRVNALKYKKL